MKISKASNNYKSDKDTEKNCHLEYSAPLD